MSVSLSGPQLQSLRAVFGSQVPGDAEAAVRMLESSPLAPSDPVARAALREQVVALAGQKIDGMKAAADALAASRPVGTGQRPTPAGLSLRIAQLTGQDALQAVQGASLQAVLTPARAQEMVDLLRGRSDIPHDFIDEGCMFRAHYGAWLLEQAGVKADKIVSHSKNGGDLRLNSDAHPAGFTLGIYHMALSVVVDEGGELVRKVIDPSFSDKPLSVEEWHSHMQAPGHGPLETYFMPRFVEMPWQLAKDAPTGWTDEGLDFARNWKDQYQQHPFFEDQASWCAQLKETWAEMEARAVQAKPAPTLSEAQRTSLLALGVAEADLARAAAGEVVLALLPTRTGDDTIGSLQVADDHVKSTIISIHDEGGGLRSMAQFRSRAYDVARAFGKGEVELGGAAVINGKIEKMLKRQGFELSTVPVPDDLGNDGQMELYTKRFEVEGASS